jgi:ribonuclease D
MDNLWLQRDFGVYIVNLFDTFHASTALELPGRSLAFLLKHYADITVDKKYQRADWRIRPLPADLLNYAQEDTHYLLYIYDRMRNELIELAKSPKTNPSEPVSTLPPLLTVFKKSAETTLKVYMKPVYTPKSYTFTLKRLISKTAISSLEALVFKHLHAWRDRKARELDESTDYVLPNYALLKLTRSLPKTLQQVVRCSGGSYPVLLANRAEALRVIEDAHEEWKAVGDENAKRDLENAAKVPMLIQTQHVRFDDEGREIGLRLDDENLAGPSVAETNILEKDRNENADLEKISDAPEESNCRINAAECQSKPNAVNFATEQHICTGLAKTSAASFSTRPMAIAESSVFWNESSSESGNSEIDNDSEKDGSVADDSRQLMKKIHDSISFAPVPPVVASEQINAQEYSLVVQDDKESEDEEDNITPIILSSIAPPQTQHRKPKERHTAMTNSELAFISLDSKLKEPVKKGNKRNRKSKIEKFGDNDSIRGKDLKELCQSHALTFTESKKEKVRNDVFDPFSEIVVDEKVKLT